MEWMVWMFLAVFGLSAALIVWMLAALVRAEVDDERRRMIVGRASTWTLIAVVITVMNGVNTFGKKGIPTLEVCTEDDTQQVQSPPSTGQTPVASNTLDAKGRLRQLESLREAGLLTKEEYEQKRKEILNDL